MTQIVAFRIGEVPFALPVSDIREVVRAVALSAVPGGGEPQEGLLNFRGQSVPLLDIRELLGLPQSPLSSRDFFVVVDAESRLTAIRVSGPVEILQPPDDAFDLSDHSLKNRLIGGTVRFDEQIVSMINPAALTESGWHERN